VAFTLDFALDAHAQAGVRPFRGHGNPPLAQYAQASTPGMFERSHMLDFNGSRAMFARARSAHARPVMLAPCP
jgi:hypothetical protein